MAHRYRALDTAQYWLVAGLADKLIQLDPTKHDKRYIRTVLISFLRDATQNWIIESIVRELTRLDPTEAGKRYTRQAVLEILGTTGAFHSAWTLRASLAGLDLTVQDLESWSAARFPPTPELLTVVRRNTALPEWLKALPTLAQL